MNIQKTKGTNIDEARKNIEQVVKASFHRISNTLEANYQLSKMAFMSKLEPLPLKTFIFNYIFLTFFLTFYTGKHIHILDLVFHYVQVSM